MTAGGRRSEEAEAHGNIAAKIVQVRSRRITALFPATVLLVTRGHTHLSNWLAALEFDNIRELDGALQDGMSYVFQASWVSEAYEVDGVRHLSLEQIFDPDMTRYRFHKLCLQSYGGDRHRWNAHHGTLKIVCGTTSEAAGEKMMKLKGDTSLLVKPDGSYAGVRSLPRGCYSWDEEDA